MNKLTVTNIWAGLNINIKNNDERYDETIYFSNSSAHFSLIKEAICCNTFGNLYEASATEKALMNFIIKFGIDIE